MYSEAVIAYNSKHSSEALRILDNLLKVKSDHLQALELRALVLKEMGKPLESKSSYQKLIAVSPPEKAAPYHFELGVIEFNAGHPEAAAPHFEQAIQYQFNLTASHFFLGLIDFNLSSKSGKLGESQKHFLAVTQGESAELKTAAHYYLGLISYKNNNGAEGTYELVEAGGLAHDLPGNAIAADISKAVDAALAPYGSARWFGNVSLLEAYNGNVSSFPNGSAAAQNATGQNSFQTLLVGGLGRMSSPLKSLQWVASYRGTFNLNYNNATSAYQFMTHTVDLYLTLHPLARTNYGFKFEGNSIFSDQATGGANFAFKPYSLTGEFGPYLRRDLGGGTQISLEAGFRPQSYSTQPDVSGNAISVRSSVSFSRASTFWNPSVFFSLEKVRADGIALRYWGTGLGSSNLMRLNDQMTLSESVFINFNQYQEGDFPRFDKPVNLHVSWLDQLTSHWSVVVDGGYQVNYSNQPDLYYFTQPVVSAGMGYSF